MSQQKELVGLQFLRAFCAIAVVIDHVSSMAGEPKYFGRQLYGKILGAGYSGVDIFFVISGFIITIVSLEEGNLFPRLSSWIFLKKRFARIIPLMWLSIFAYAGLRIIGRSNVFDFRPYLRAATLFPSGTVEPSIIWTLRHEFIFYALFALTFLQARIVRYALFFWFLSPLIYIPIYVGWTVAPGYSFGDILFNSANLEFGAGFMLGLGWLKNRRTAIFEWRPFSFPIHPIITIAAATVATILLSSLVPFPWRSLPVTLVLCLLGVITVWISVSINCPQGRLTRFGILLGDASYSIYLFHLHFSSALLGFLSKHAAQMPLPLVVALIVVLATAASIFVHLFVERPLVQYAQSKLFQKSSNRAIL